MRAIDDLLPKAVDLRQKIAEVESQKASEYMRKQAAADAEKKEPLDKLSTRQAYLMRSE